MSKRDDFDLRCVPVDPTELFQRLSHALGIIPENTDANAIVSRPFPDVAAENFRDLYLLKEVLRKYQGFILGIDTHKKALESFQADEALNAITNARLSDHDTQNAYVRQIFSSASRKAMVVLGEFRSDWLLDGTRFGPGATTRLGGKSATIKEKLSGIPHVSMSAFHLADAFMRSTPQWRARVGLSPLEDAYVPCGDYSSIVADVPFVIRDLDTFMTVPKNAVTDRTIGVGPCMNVALQLGVGYHMRKRLYPWGINLNDQSINQRRAREGSITGRLATLDIKSASNSVTCGLVWHFLGNHSHEARYFDPTWYEVLNKLRTQGCLIDGVPHEYELFSAMGCGFTFELQSLIFWSLACATCELLALPEDCTVYGDDIILPVEAVPLFTEVLFYCGFRLNADKSFATTEGPLFRESCGSHFLDGRDVTPFYIDEALNTVDQILLLANNIVRWSRIGTWGLDGRLEPVWLWVVSHLSQDVRGFGIPYSTDANDGLILPFDQTHPSIAFLGNPVIKGTEKPCRSTLAIGYRVKTVAYETREVAPVGQVGLTCWLYLAEKRRFSPPTEPSICPSKLPYLWEPGVSGRGCVPSLFAAPRRCSMQPVVKQALKMPKDARQRTLKVKSRVVGSWPETGPWVG